MTHITLLTQQSYLNPQKGNPYTDNILLERKLLIDALEAKGLTVTTTYWDNPDYDWSQTKAVVFRTIWDYFERYDEFALWLETIKTKTRLINPYPLIQWNIDKHYLSDLYNKGIAIVPTVFVDTGNHQSLAEICKQQDGQIS